MYGGSEQWVLPWKRPTCLFLGYSGIRDEGNTPLGRCRRQARNGGRNTPLRIVSPGSRRWWWTTGCRNSRPREARRRGRDGSRRSTQLTWKTWMRWSPVTAWNSPTLAPTASSGQTGFPNSRLVVGRWNIRTESTGGLVDVWRTGKTPCFSRCHWSRGVGRRGDDPDDPGRAWTGFVQEGF